METISLVVAHVERHLIMALPLPAILLPRPDFLPLELRAAAPPTSAPGTSGLFRTRKVRMVSELLVHDVYDHESEIWVVL